MAEEKERKEIYTPADEFKRLAEEISQALEEGLEWVNVKLEEGLERVSPYLDQVIEEAKERIRQEFGDLIADIAGAILSGIVQVIYYGGYAIGLGWGALDVGRVKGQRAILSYMPIYIPSPSDAVDMYFKGLIGNGELEDILRQHGISSEWIERILRASEKPPTPETIRELYRRKLIDTQTAFELYKANGIPYLTASLHLALAYRYLSPELALRAWRWGLISEEELELNLQREGYFGRDIDVLKKLTEVIPGVSDLIRFAVREAFNPEAIQKFNLLAEFPEELVKWAEKQGLSRYWAERYWIAHWELPSITMALEMFRRTTTKPVDPDADVIVSPFGGERRNVIGRRTLEMLIKAQDISPFWRDKIIQISYNPLTRVDLRRAYDLGVIDENEVYFGYRDLGYDDRNARILTEYTIIDTISEERNKVRNEAIQLFIDGVLTESELTEILIALRYNEKTINVLLEYAKFRKARKRIETRMKSIKRLFMRGELDEDEARERLIKEGIEIEDAILIVEDWKYEKDAKDKALTKEEIKEAVKRRIISPEEGRKYLYKLGYDDPTIDILYKLWGVK